MSACVLAPYQQMTPEQKNALPKAETLVVIGQREVNAEIVVSNVSGAVGGGLIAAMIDAGVNNSRVKDAEAAVVPLRDSLVGYDFDGMFVTELDQALRAMPAFAAGQVAVLREASDKAVTDRVRLSRNGAVLSLAMSYSLSPTFDAITIYAAPTLWPNPGAFKADGSLDRAKSLYRNVLRFSVALATPTKALEENRQQWAANNGALLRTALSNAAHEIAQAVAYDMMQGPIAAPDHVENVVLQDGSAGTRDRQGGLQFKITTQNLLTMAAVASKSTSVSTAGTPASVSATATTPAAAPAAAMPALIPAAAPAAPVAPAAAAPAPAKVSASAATGPRTRIDTALRRQPSLDGKRERPLAAGTVVQVTTTVPNAQGTWVFVRVDGDTGWLPADELASVQ